jgi:dTMP kinase
MSRRGLFITFEGPEGSGKSTHSKLLCDFLRRKGFNVLHTREPGGTYVSEKIRRVLLDPRNKDMGVVCEMLLYMAARAQIMEQKILPALKKGKTVVCDRFVDATLVYQGYAGGLDPKIIRDIARLVTRRVLPRLTFLLDIDVKKGLLRSGKVKDRIEKKSLTYHKKVRKGYLAIARKEPGRVKLVSALGEVAINQERIRRIALGFLGHS